MTISLVPSLPFTDNVSVLTASTANSWRANMAKALDRVGGSGGVAETPSTVIDIAGAGLKISGSGAAARVQYASSSEVRTQRSFLLNNDTGSVKVGSIVLAATEQGMQYLGKNGLTGLVQINLHRNLSPDEIEYFNFYYAKNQSIALDIEILLKTLSLFLFRKNVPNL